MAAPKVTVLIMAAGAGLRVGGSTPKQYQMLGGSNPALPRAIVAFADHPRITTVCCVIGHGDTAAFEHAVGNLPVAQPILGGATRQDSVRNGLEALAGPDQPEFVLIHDAARPIVPPTIIEAVLDALANHDAAAPALAVADTLARSVDNQIGDPVPRDNLKQIQTPQGFRFTAILEAHRALTDHAVTDDISLIRHAGGSAAMVHGSPLLHKITTEADKMMIERLLLGSPRVGNGYDVHAFGPGDHVTLCGVDIPHDAGLVGHSDADVAMHAATDAILGAIAAGDIGTHFPPSDPQWRGAASEIFLAEAVRLVQAKGGGIAHIDITIVCETPKVGPHRQAMQAKMAGIMGLDCDRVSIKATTSERLGFTGRKEGIAALATATVML